jgi:hypothetical protein
LAKQIKQNPASSPISASDYHKRSPHTPRTHQRLLSIPSIKPQPTNLKKKMSYLTEQINKSLESLPIPKTQEVTNDTQKQEERLENTQKNDEKHEIPQKQNDNEVEIADPTTAEVPDAQETKEKMKNPQKKDENAENAQKKHEDE